MQQVALPQGFPQHTGRLGMLRRQQQVNMVGHEDVSVDTATSLVGIFAQRVRIDAAALDLLFGIGTA